MFENIKLTKEKIETKPGLALFIVLSILLSKVSLLSIILISVFFLITGDYQTIAFNDLFYLYGLILFNSFVFYINSQLVYKRNFQSKEK